MGLSTENRHGRPCFAAQYVDICRGDILGPHALSNKAAERSAIIHASGGRTYGINERAIDLMSADQLAEYLDQVQYPDFPIRIQDAMKQRLLELHRTHEFGNINDSQPLVDEATKSRTSTHASAGRIHGIVEADIRLMSAYQCAEYLDEDQYPEMTAHIKRALAERLLALEGLPSDRESVWLKLQEEDS